VQADFLELMHQRFLAGEDEAFVNYGQIDADAALDDDWADERRQVHMPFTMQHTFDLSSFSVSVGSATVSSPCRLNANRGFCESQDAEDAYFDDM